MPTNVAQAFDSSYVKCVINGDKKSSIRQYFNKIIYYLYKFINDYQPKGEWELQLSIQVIFSSITDENKTDIMHTKSDNIEIFKGYSTSDITDRLYNTLINRYQESLENKMNGSNYAFDDVHLLDITLNKISINRGSTYIPTPKWIANEKFTINTHNDKDSMCFIYAIIVANHYKNISNDPRRISELIPYIKYYDWNDINFNAGPSEYNAFEKNNEKYAINVLYAVDDKKDIRRRYISKHNKTCDHKINLLMITDGKCKWHYVAIKSIPALLKGVSSKHNGGFYCLNCFNSYKTKRKLDDHEKLCGNKDFSAIKMPEEKNKFISSTPGKNTLKNPFIIYADFECILKPISTCDKTPDKSFTIKKDIHITCGISMLTSYAYDKKSNYHTRYRGKGCLPMFSKALKTEVEKIMSIKQKPMDPITEQEVIAHNNAKTCFICEKTFDDDQNNIKVRDHSHYTGKYTGAVHSVCNLQYKVPKNIPVVFHNGSTYDFQIVIKQLPKDFDGPFNCLDENTEKYITFSICYFKKTKGNKRPLAYKIKFIDSLRHMQQSLSNLVDNVPELNINLPDDVLINRFYNTHQFCDNGIAKFKLSLRKGIYPYEYMDSWKKFDEPVPLMKEANYNEFNDTNINDSDLEHVKNVCSTFKIADLGSDHDHYVGLDVSLVANVFENFRDTALKIDKLEPAYYLSAPCLSWQSCLKKLVLHYNY